MPAFYSFINLKTIEGSIVDKNDYARLNFFLNGERKTTTRAVYTLSGLLQDAGGMYASLIWLGSVLHFFFSGLDSGLIMLQQFYKVEVKGKKQLNTQERRHMKTTSNDSLLYGTVVSRLICLFFCCRKRREKMLRHLKILRKADQNLERSLDVRTLIKVQSLVKSLIKVTFEKRHLLLLKEQRNMRVIAKIDRSGKLSAIASSSDGNLLYDSTASDPAEKQARKALYASQISSLN